MGAGAAEPWDDDDDDLAQAAAARRSVGARYRNRVKALLL
jgi:hypothetical protein